MFICRKCQKPAPFLFRGMCEKCAPDVHHEFNETLAVYAALSKQYEAETGKRAIDDLDAFDEWWQQNPIPQTSGE